MELNDIPRLAPGCRMHPTQELLLVPEGALKLSGPARDILALIDNKRDLSAIVDEIAQRYAGADRNEIQADLLTLLERMQERGFIRIGGSADEPSR
jgi:pyrroloquinoline quinone biosynthesis protein D